MTKVTPEFIYEMFTKEGTINEENVCDELIGGLSAKALWRLIKNQRAIKAIPKEWIKEKLEKEEYRAFLVDYIEWGNCLRWLLEEWEKENE